MQWKSRFDRMLRWLFKNEYSFVNPSPRIEGDKQETN